MPKRTLPYEQWLDEGLRGVVRRALAFAADFGLPSQHHFYITFATGAAGVQVPPDIKARYPNEMTIVLQHQFWDLVVDDEAFAVTLKFQGRSSRLRVPFTAVSTFADPSVNFGLQLRQPERRLEAEEADADAPSAAELLEAEKQESPAKAAASAGKPQPAGQVIPLDSFRKK